MADLKNVGAGPYGGAITAALYLAEFVEPPPPPKEDRKEDVKEDGKEGGGSTNSAR